MKVWLIRITGMQKLSLSGSTGPTKQGKAGSKSIASIFILYLSVLCVRRLINSAYKHVNNSGGIYLKTCAT